MLSDSNLSIMPEDASQWDCPTLLDINAVKPLLDWLNSHRDFAARLIDERWRIGILEAHVEGRSNWVKLREDLESKNIEIIDYIFTGEDSLLITEIQRAYFGSDSESRKSAELLAYGRRHSDGSDVRVISRHRCFRLIPNVQLFRIENIQDIGQEDDAVMWRLLQSLELHERVRVSALPHIFNHQYPTAVLHAVNELYAYIRAVSGLTTDGHKLINQAFGANNPAIHLFDLSLEANRKEQQGFENLGYGITSALRNLLSHNLADHTLLHDRFGDRRTALKILAVISIFFERIDKRVSP